MIFDFDDLDEDSTKRRCLSYRQGEPTHQVLPTHTKVRVHRIRPPVKAHGGKYYLARQIVPILLSAPGKISEYLEPCVFGGSVYLAMPKFGREILGDINPGVVNLWRVLTRSECAKALTDKLSEVSYTQESFDNALQDNPLNEIDQAAKFVVQSRFSRGGFGKAFAWSERLRGGVPGDVNSWKTFREKVLPAIISRADGAEVVEDECWWTVWESRDKIQRLVYVDPPYMPDTRTAKKAYGEFEMDRLHHFWLVSALRALDGPAAISGYRNDDYDRWLNDWRRFDFDMPNNSSQSSTKQRRIESLWVNW